MLKGGTKNSFIAAYTLVTVGVQKEQLRILDQSCSKGAIVTLKNS